MKWLHVTVAAAGLLLAASVDASAQERFVGVRKDAADEVILFSIEAASGLERKIATLQSNAKEGRGPGLGNRIKWQQVLCAIAVEVAFVNEFAVAQQQQALHLAVLARPYCRIQLLQHGRINAHLGSLRPGPAEVLRRNAGAASQQAGHHDQLEYPAQHG